jgi:hypothetical protein
MASLAIAKNKKLQAIWAFAALLIGCAVYAVDRQGNAVFLPTEIPYPQNIALFAHIAGWLPSLLHTFAFVVASALVWGSSRKQIYLLCALWVGIEVLMETLQFPSVAAELRHWNMDSTAAGAYLIAYSEAGVFSLGDVIAIAVGALCAGWILQRIQ